MLIPTAAQHRTTLNIRPNRRALACAVALFSGFACAGDEEASLFSLSLEELMTVKVTVASLVEESELDAPASVAKLTREDWNRNGSRRLTEALESIPNVVSHEIWGGTETISIRGYSTELSGVRGLATSLDGVPLNTYTHATSAYYLPNIALDSLQQVEMIRGPGSTLYGTDAFHGVVAMSTRNSDTDITEVSAETGFPTWGAGSIFTSSKFGDIRSNVGLSYQKQGEQDIGYQYTDPVDGSQQRGERDNVYRNVTGYGSWIWGDRNGSGSWKLSTFLNDYQAERFAGLGTQFFASFPAAYELESANLSEDRDLTDQDARFLMGQLRHNISLNDKVSVESGVYHWYSEFNWRYDNSRYPLEMTHRGRTTPTVIAPGTVLPCRPSDTVGGTPTTTGFYCPHVLSQFYEEKRSGIQSTLRWQDVLPGTSAVAGLGWDNQKLLNAYFERVTVSNFYQTKGAQGYSGKSRDIRYVFFQGKTAFANEKLALHYGLRYDDYSDGNEHSSPRLGLVWRASDNWTSKLLYGQAFRAPNASEQYQTSGASLSANLDIKPEIIDTLEWVNIFHTANAKHELVLFSSKWKDGILLEPITPGSPVNVYRNTGDNKSQGAEFSSRWRVGDWHFGGSLSFTDSTNKTADRDYVAFPKWLSTLEASYSIPQHALELSLKQRIQLDYADTDQIGSSDYPRDNNYYRTDFSITKKIQTHENAPELFAHFYNIFDKTNHLPALYNAEGGIPDDGLRVALGGRWKW